MGNKPAKFKEDLNDLGSDESLVQELRAVPLLSKYSDPELAKLGALVSQKTFEAGATIIRQGDAAEGFFIIRSGQVAVEVASEEKVQEVAQLTDNDYFGECALLQKNSTRNSTIRCLVQTKTFYLSTADFKKIFSEAALNVQFVKRKVAVTAGTHDQTYERPADVSTDKPPEVAERIYNVVKDNLLFARLAPEVAQAIIAEMHMQPCSDGQEVISQGDKGDYFYVIETGVFDIIVHGNKVAEFGVGKAFGELALMYNSPRKATVRATSGCSVWAIHRVLFRMIVKEHSQGALAQYTSFLKDVPLLQGLANYERNKIADALEVVDIGTGETLFEQGEEGSAMYILKQGDVEITKDGEVLTNYTQPGAFFGERSLVTKEPRAGKAVAKAPTTLLVIDKQTFDTLLGPLNDLLSKAVSSYNSSNAREEKQAEPSRDSVLDDWQPVPFEKLKTLGTLGKGSFGHVTLVQAEGDDRTFALKAIKKAMIVETNQQGHVMSEKRVMEQLRHPFLIRLFQTYKDRDNLYFLLEPVMGGELFTVLRKMHLFIDKTARFYAACVVLAFEYMHSLDIIYRDLKPENLLVDEKGYIKVTDFGFAKKIDSTQRTWTLCGTPDYLAPEIVGGNGHGKGVDWWTLGILIYEMLDGQPPFYDEDAMNTYNMIMAGDVKFKQHFTAQARSLIKKLLYKKATRRLGVVKGGASLIKKHVWFQSYNKQFAETLLTGWDELYNKNVKAPHVPKINSATDMSNFDFDDDEDDGYAGPYIDDGTGWDAGF